MHCFSSAFDSSVADLKGTLQCSEAEVNYAKTGYPVRRYIHCLAFFPKSCLLATQEQYEGTKIPSTIGRCDIRSMTRAAVSEVSFNECRYLRDDASPGECSNTSDIVLVLSIAVLASLSFRSQATAAAESARLRPGTGTGMQFRRVQFPMLQDAAECTFRISRRAYVV